MKTVLLAVLLLLVMAGSANSMVQVYSVEFDIQPDFVMEDISIDLGQAAGNTVFEHIIVGDYSGLAIEVDGKQAVYSETRDRSTSKISIQVPAGTSLLRISYAAEDLNFESDGAMQFFTVLSPPEAAGRLDIRAWLPKGYVLSMESRTYPSNPITTSDGERIALDWWVDGWDSDVPISFRFHAPLKATNLPLFIGIPASAGVAVFLFFYHRKRVSEMFLKGFLEDERLVIEKLKGKKYMYQNKLERQLGFSKAKMSRMVKKLEMRNLVEKKKMGRTNRLAWKGG